MTLRLSGHFSLFGLVFFELKSLPGIARQWSHEKIAVLSVKPRSHVRILIYRTKAIRQGKNPVAPMVICTMPQFDEKD